MAGTRAALKLDDMAARRGPPSTAPTAGDDARRGQTLRLKPAAWTQLKILAAEQGKPSHDLLIEAVNLLFDHYGKPPIAG
jgi:Antitoxin-like ribbon-helix-helix